MAMNRQRLFPVLIFLFGAWSVQAKDTDQTRLAREEMVAKQIAARGIEDSHVLRAMRAVPRHMFIPEMKHGLRMTTACTDWPWPDHLAALCRCLHD